MLHLPTISAAVPKPLYEQIIEGIKREVSAGRLPAHTALPSFRGLAEDLFVSIITVKRAYEELEHEGIIYRKQGLGTFVAENAIARCRTNKSAQAESLMKQALQECKEVGMTKNAAMNLIQELMKNY